MISSEHSADDTELAPLSIKISTQLSSCTSDAHPVIPMFCTGITREVHGLHAGLFR